MLLFCSPLRHFRLRPFGSLVREISCHTEQSHPSLPKLSKSERRLSFSASSSYDFSVGEYFDPRGRPHDSDHYIHTCCMSFCPSVRPFQNCNIKRKSLPVGTVGWPSGSSMTPVLSITIIKHILDYLFCLDNKF